MQVNSVSLANANSKPVFKGPREEYGRNEYSQVGYGKNV